MKLQVLFFSLTPFSKRNSLFFRHVELRELKPGSPSYVFTLQTDPGQKSGEIGLNVLQRKWAMLSLNDAVDIKPFAAERSKMCITNITLQTKFFSPKKYVYCQSNPESLTLTSSTPPPPYKTFPFCIRKSQAKLLKTISRKVT